MPGQGERASKESDPDNTWILYVLPPELWGNKCLLFQPHHPWHSLMSAWANWCITSFLTATYLLSLAFAQFIKFLFCVMGPYGSLLRMKFSNVQNIMHSITQETDSWNTALLVDPVGVPGVQDTNPHLSEAVFIHSAGAQSTAWPGSGTPNITGWEREEQLGYENESHSVISNPLQPQGLYTPCIEFFRPEYWSGYPFPSPGDLINPGIEPMFPALQADSLPAKPQGKPTICKIGKQ